MRHRSPGSFSHGSQVLRSPLGINFDARKERFSVCGPGAEIYSGTRKSGDPILSQHRAWSLFHAAFPQRRRPLFVGLGWSLSSLQVACMFYSFTFTSVSRAEGPTLGSALRVCMWGEAAYIGRTEESSLPRTHTPLGRDLCLFPGAPIPSSSGLLQAQEAPFFHVLLFYEGQSLWPCTLMAHIPFPLLDQWDGKWAKVRGSKFDNLSSICRPHLVEKTNQLPVAVLRFSHICLCMGTTKK